MSADQDNQPALPLEELNLTPEWVRAPSKSYANHSGEDRPSRDRRPGGRGPRRDRSDRGDRPPRFEKRRPEQRSGPPSSPGSGKGSRGGPGAPPRDDSKFRPRGPRRDRPPGKGERRGPSAPSPAPVEVQFFPEDKGFNAMLEAMRHSPRSYALFDLAKLVLNKPERHVVRLKRGPAPDGTVVPLYLVKASETPCLSLDEAVRQVFRRQAEEIFQETKRPVDPPKGNFTYVNRCGVTGAWLGPPNFHEYQARLVRHHQQRLAHMPFEQLKARIQTVKDPEAVQAWIQSMSFVTEYQCRVCARPAAPVESGAPPAPPTSEVTPDSATPSIVADAPVPVEAGSPAPTEGSEPAAAAAETPSADEAAAPPPEPSAPPVFAGRDDLEKHFLEAHLEEFVLVAPELRLSGTASRQTENPALAEAIRQAWESERRFPLNTANGMRARLRHEGFQFFKNHKGITYLGRVKPRRVGQIEGLAPQIQQIVQFVREHRLCTFRRLADHLLKPAEPSASAAPSAAETAAAPAQPDRQNPMSPAPAEPAAGTGEPVVGTAPSESSPVSQLSPEQSAAPAPETGAAPSAAPRPSAEEERLLADLHWLIQDGYVVEFSDGRLWVMEERPPQPPSPPREPKTPPAPPKAEDTTPVTTPAEPAEPAAPVPPSAEAATPAETSPGQGPPPAPARSPGSGVGCV